MQKHPLIPYLPGAVVVLAGIAIALVAASYPLGTLLRPGPGFFPIVIAVTLSLLGLGVLYETWAARGTPLPQMEPFAWRAVICTCAGVLVFALTVERLGYIPASCLLIGITALAEPGPNWRALLLVALFMSVFGTLIFILGLGLPISAFGAS